MGASFEREGNPSNVDRIFEALFHDEYYAPRQSFPGDDVAVQENSTDAVWHFSETGTDGIPAGFVLRLVQDRADINISGPEFNFVRSIRVFDIRHAQQQESGRDGGCNRSAVVVLGTYGTQGDFSWQISSTAALPSAHVGLERWGQHCPSVYHRSVFVDWHDYEGNYGFEQVNY
jgi:hypothetical protein